MPEKFYTNWKVFGIFVVLGLIIILVSQAALRDAERTAVREFVERQDLIAKQTLEGIQTVLKSAFGDARYLATFPEVIHMDTEGTRRHFWRVYRAHSDIVASITRMDSAGVIVVTVPFKEYEGADISWQPHIRKVLHDKKPVIGGPIKTVQGFEAIIYHHPVFADSVFTGTVAILISFDSLVNRFFKPLFGRSGQIIWLVDESGRILVHSVKSPGGNIVDLYYASYDGDIKRYFANFPYFPSKSVCYTDKSGKKRILVCHSANVGVDRWIVGIDSDYSLATAPLLPLRWKIFGMTLMSLLTAFFAVHLMFLNARKKFKIEQQEQILELENEHRRKLGQIYSFAQSLVYPREGGPDFEDVAGIAADVFDADFVLSWIYSDKDRTFHPGPFVVKDFRVQDELRRAGIDLSHIELGDRIHDYNPQDLPTYLVLPVKEVMETNLEVAAVVYAVKPVRDYSHIAFVSLKLRDKIFGVLAIPVLSEKELRTELLETFSLAISQSLYIRTIIAELYSASRIYRDILNTIDKAIFLVDANMTVLSVSPEFYRIFDVKGEAVGRNLFDVVPFLKDIRRDVIYSEVIRSKSPVETEEVRIVDENRKIVTRTKIIPVVDSEGKVHRILTIVEDITDFRLLEEQLKRTAEELARKNRQLERLAVTDELTQLRNYRYFTENLTKLIEKHYSAGEPLALLAMDLDDFKKYNDTYGHQAGDRLLAEIAEIVRGFLRADDFAARYGGDEFVLVLSHCDVDEAVDTAERLCARIANTPLPDAAGERTQHITASIGVAVMKDEFVEAEELLRRADAALYVSKARGKGQVTLYEVKIDGQD